MTKIYTYIKFKLLILAREIVAFGIPVFMFIPIFVFLVFIATRAFASLDYGNYALYITYFNVLFSYQIKNKERDLLQLFFKYPFWLYFLLNLILTIPFLLIAIYLSYYFIAALILLTLIVLSSSAIKISFLVLDKLNLSFLMPNVEFSSGIRKYWYVHLLGLLVLIVGFLVDNYNVSILGFFIFILTFGFYFSIIEPITWIFSYGLSPNEYIDKKISTIAKILIIVSLPFAIMLSFKSKNLMLFYFVFVLMLGIINQFLSKYAYYHSLHTIKFNQSIIMAITIVSCVSPYFLVIHAYSFYYLRKQAVKTLNSLLC